MIEIITIGDELVSGMTLNQNSKNIAEALFFHGLSVKRIITVGDDQEDIVGALRSIRQGTRYVIVTGGLGETDDDHTVRAAAEAFNRNLMVRSISEIGKEAERESPLPEGCQIVPNPLGTAYAFTIEEDDKIYLFIPGVPEEATAIMKVFIVDHILKDLHPEVSTVQRTMKVFGIWEPEMEKKLGNLAGGKNGVSIGSYPHYPEITLVFTGKGKQVDDVNKAVNDVWDEVLEKLGEFVYSGEDETLEQVIQNLLHTKDATLAVADGLTGGIITSKLTNASHEYDYLERAYIVRSDTSKYDLLRSTVTPVSRENGGAIINQMAKGVRNRAQSTYGLAVDGFLEKADTTERALKGTIWVGISSETQTTIVKQYVKGSKEMCLIMASHVALGVLRNEILGKTTRFFGGGER